jgi:hypothetical protein
MINFQTSPANYKHWRLEIDGAVATLSMDVQEDQTLAGGYKLKLNSYDLGVDIELADAVQRLRFEHPEVRAVVITSLKPRIFCAERTSTCSVLRRTHSRSTSVSSQTKRVARLKMIRAIQAVGTSPP